MKNKLIQSGFLLLLTLLCHSQTPLFTPVTFTKDYTIHDIKQDSCGFLWMATSEGLVFYNGFEENLITPPEIGVFGICIDQNKVYAGLENGDIFIIDSALRQVVDSILINSDARINSIIKAENHLWASSYGKGLFKIDLKSKEIDSYSDKLSSLYIYGLETLSTDKIAIASDRGIDIIDTKTDSVSSLRGLPDVIITNLAFDGNNILWASTYGQSIFSYSFSDATIKENPFEEKHIIQDIVLYNQQKIVNTDNGVFLLDKQNKWQVYFEPKINNQKFTSMIIDQENNLWVSSTTNPIWKASLYFSVLDFPEIEEIQAIEKRNSNLYLGNKDGLYKYNEIKRSTTKLLENNITCLIKSENLFIAGTYSNGIYVFDHSDELLFHLSQSNGLKENAILDIAFFKDSSLLISTLSGVFIVQYGLSSSGFKIESIETISEDLSYSYVMDLYACQDGNILFGKDKTGFSVFAESRLKNFSTLNDENSKLGSVYSIASASNNTWWLSSKNLGLLNYTEDSLRQINSIDYNDHAYTSVIPLVNNQLLLVRASSIDLFDVIKEHVMYFDQEAIIVDQEAFINNYAQDNGETWFVHHDRVYKFHTPSGNQKIHPTTSIDAVEVNLEPSTFDTRVYKQKANNFKFMFTGGWLTDPGKLSYAYYLEGYDSHWRETKDRSISYPLLPPGKYKFHVKATENNYFSDEDVTTYSFEIRRSFFNSLIFYSLITILSLGFIIWLIKRDQREKELKVRLEQKQIETQLINLKAQLNPHFLFNSFNTLSGLIEENPDKGISYIENITDFYRYILELGDEKLIPLSKEIDMVHIYEKLLSERFGNGFNINYQLHDLSVVIPPMTIQMLIENAIKHNQLSRKKPLTIDIVQDKNGLKVVNSKAPKNMMSYSTGLGLKNIRDRYRILGYKDIIIEDLPNQFSVYLPNKKHTQ